MPMSDNQTASREVEISLIVPIYNVAPYLEECLQSIHRQSFGGAYETLLIDDRSTDESYALCRDFIERHGDGFRLLQNPRNRGVGATRNRGLDEARGRYFMFIDPDDLLPANALSALYQAAERHGASIVKGNNTIFDTTQERDARYNVARQILQRDEAVLTTLYLHETVRGHPWGKLFHRASLGGYRFPEGVRMAQDLLYCSEVFAHANSLLLVPEIVYRYRDRDTGSTGSKFRSGSYIDWLDAVQETGRFASTTAQRRAHKNLLVRTMTQLARESRSLPREQAEPVLAEIENRCDRWGIRLMRLLLIDRLGLRPLARYFKMRLAISETRRGLANSRTSEPG